MQTNIYHISHAPASKEVSLFFWGCNFNCLGCLCQKSIHNFLLKENLRLPFQEPGEIAAPPQKLLTLEEVTGILDELKPETVLFEGQEASLDPAYPALTKMTHERYGSRNLLCSNLYSLPPLEDTDAVAVGMKAYTDSIHREYTGKSNQRVFKNFVKLYESGMRLSVTFVFVPGLIDFAETENIAKFIASVDPEISLNIVPYFRAGDNPWRHPTSEEIEAATRIAGKYLKTVRSWKGDENLDYEVVKVV